MSKEALKLALSKIKSARDCHPNAVQELIFEAEELLEQALAAPVQEPVAWGKLTNEMVQAATDEYDEWAADNKGTTECIRAMLVKALKATPLAAPVHQTCNCRWDGEVQVQQCTLHQAHVDAIHEWAERAKAAQAKLAAQPAPVQEPVARVCFEGDEVMWIDEPLESGTLLYTTPPAAPAQEFVCSTGLCHYRKPQQEPVAWADMEVRNRDVGLSWTPGQFHIVPLYTTPPASPVQEPDHSDELTIAYMSGVHRGKELAAQRQWVGLSDECVKEIREQCDSIVTLHAIKAIEAKLKEKNT